METAFFKMIDGMTKDCLVYTHKNNIWLINPKTKEWVISYYTKTKYTWWNYDFFKPIYLCLSMDMKKIEPIKHWVESRMNVETGNCCEPDKFPYDYDWSSDFNVDEVLIDGKVL